MSDTDAMYFELEGIHPALDKVLAGLAELATADLTRDHTSSLLAVLGGDTSDGIDVLNLIGHVVARIGDPARNSAMRDVPACLHRAVRENTLCFQQYLLTWPPRELLAEASWDTDRATLHNA